DVDRVAFLESHDGLFDVALQGAPAAKLLQLALADERVDRLDLDVEQLLNGRLDGRLRRFPPDVEGDLVELRGHGRLLGDDRTDDHVVDIELHLNRASSASTAAFVSTSLRRRRMS